jgi:glycerophosphoryl diester phosphodiesterase
MNVLVELKINMTSESTNACSPIQHPLCAGAIDGWTKDRVAAVIADINRHQMTSRATLISYGKTVLTWAERIAPSVRTQYIGFTYAGARHYPAGIDQVALKATWIKHHPGIVTWFAARGISVQGQESNTTAEFKTFYTHGVHQILTDSVPALRTSMRKTLRARRG